MSAFLWLAELETERASHVFTIYLVNALVDTATEGATGERWLLEAFLAT